VAFDWTHFHTDGHSTVALYLPTAARAGAAVGLDECLGGDVHNAG
jgi:hypothetical protein